MNELPILDESITWVCPDIKKGDIVTIQGIRVRPDGTWTKRCKPGNETPLRVGKVVKSRKRLRHIP